MADGAAEIPGADARSAVPDTPLPDELRSLLERSEEAIYALDPQGRLRWASPATLRLLGAPDVDALSGRTFDELWATPGRRRVFLRRLRDAGRVEGFPRQLRGLDGTRVLIRESRYVRRDDDGRLQGYVGMLQRSRGGGHGTEAASLTRDFQTGAYARDCLERIEVAHRRCACLVLEITAPRGGPSPHHVRALSHLVIRSTRADDLLVALAPDRLVLLSMGCTLPGLRAVAERIAAKVDQETGLRVVMRLSTQGQDEPVQALIDRASADPDILVHSRHPGEPSRGPGRPPRGQWASRGAGRG